MLTVALRRGLNTMPLALLSLLACAAPPALEEAPDMAVGRCNYINGFTQQAECKEYWGSSWLDGNAELDCADPVPGSSPGDFKAARRCQRRAVLAECYIEEGTIEAANLVFPQGPETTCEGLQTGCFFAEGRYQATELCP